LPSTAGTTVSKPTAKLAMTRVPMAIDVFLILLTYAPWEV
jgi:hypothetical protein